MDDKSKMDLALIKIKENFSSDINFRWEFDDSMDDKFNQWFLEKSEIFERMDDEGSVIKNLSITQKTESQCFQNAQLIALKNKDIKYYEGLVYGIKFQMTVHHGFNVVDNKAFDITDFYNQTFKNDKDTNWHKEVGFLYYGIHIPNEFLAKYLTRLKTPKTHNPLIHEYFSYLSQKLK